MARLYSIQPASGAVQPMNMIQEIDIFPTGSAPVLQEFEDGIATLRVVATTIDLEGFFTATNSVVGGINQFTMTSGSFTDFSVHTPTSFYDISEITIPAIEYNAYAQNHNSLAFLAYLFHGSEVIQGSSGVGAGDTLLGFEGNDVIYGGGIDIAPIDGNDILLGNAGDDTVFGNAGDDIIYGGSQAVDSLSGNDFVYGGLGNDTIYGNGGNDTMSAGPGDDHIYSGIGNDLLSGNDGNDIFYFGSGGGYDTILSLRQGDVLAIHTNINNSGIVDFASLMTHLISDANGSFIGLGAGHGITLAGIQPNDLDSSDFAFF